MNPLTNREFFGILRTRQALGALLALSVAFSVVVLFRWPTDAQVDLTGTQSLQVFRVFGYGLLAGVVLLVPAFPAASIVREKNAGTLALLLNSPLRPASIYFGKLSGVLLFSSLILITSLPAAAACYAMGGVDLVMGLGMLYAVLLVLIVQYATLGLMISMYVQTTDAGVRITYALVFAISFLALVPYYFYQGQDGFLPAISVWLRYLSPLPVIAGIMGLGDIGSQGLVASSQGIREFFLLAAAATFAFLVIGLSRLNYRIYDQARDQGLITDDRVASVRVARRFFFLVDPQRRKSGIPWYLNPVMVKEFRCRRFGRTQWLLRLVAVCAVASLLLTFASTIGVMDWGVETIGGIMVILQVLLVVLITPSLAAGLISAERDSGGWELLRMTPLSALEILRGKLLSVVWTLALILLATLPGYLVMWYIKPTMWLQIQTVSICLVLTAIYTMLVSAAVGSMFSRTAVATTTAYIVMIALFLGPMLIWMGRDAPFGHRAVQSALTITPLGAALSVIETPGFIQYELLPISWWIAGVVSVSMLLVLSVQTWRLTRPC